MTDDNAAVDTRTKNAAGNEALAFERGTDGAPAPLASVASRSRFGRRVSVDPPSGPVVGG
jgi:hypothetical protein